MDAPKPIRNPEIKYTQLFINNEFVNSVSGKTFPTINPGTEEVTCQVQEGDKADVDKAVTAAKNAFKRNTPWRTMDASKRGELMNKLADLIERDLVYIASVETLDCGKPFRIGALEDIKDAVRTLRYNAAWADKICGQTIPADGPAFTYTRYEPFGVVGFILPWNFPLAIAIVKLSSALAVGNTCIIKPAEQTPLTTIYLGHLAKEAGFPPGVVNVISGYGPTAGAAIASHPDVRMVAFTGSTEVGRLVMEAAAKSNLKKVQLELGGKSPNIIFPDTDIDDVVQHACEAVMFTTGECCVGGTRTFVHEDIYDEFVRKSVEYVKKKVTGDPFETDTTMGPLIDADQYKKVLGFLEAGPREGAKVQIGGAKCGGKGYFVQPTIFSDVTNKMSIAREEIFGPVQSILKFKDFEDVIEQANDTEYGLGGAVFSKDIDRALTVAHAIQAGTVWVNQYFGGVGMQTTFGGYKQSGIGREGGRQGVEEFCEIKTVSVRLSTKNS